MAPQSWEPAGAPGLCPWTRQPVLCRRKEHTACWCLEIMPRPPQELCKYTTIRNTCAPPAKLMVTGQQGSCGNAVPVFCFFLHLSPSLLLFLSPFCRNSYTSLSVNGSQILLYLWFTLVQEIYQKESSTTVPFLAGWDTECMTLKLMLNATFWATFKVWPTSLCATKIPDCVSQCPLPFVLLLSTLLTSVTHLTGK